MVHTIDVEEYGMKFMLKDSSDKLIGSEHRLTLQSENVIVTDAEKLLNALLDGKLLQSDGEILIDNDGQKRKFSVSNETLIKETMSALDTGFGEISDLGSWLNERKILTEAINDRIAQNPQYLTTLHPDIYDFMVEEMDYKKDLTQPITLPEGIDRQFYVRGGEHTAIEGQDNVYKASVSFELNENGTEVEPTFELRHLDSKELATINQSDIQDAQILEDYAVSTTHKIVDYHNSRNEIVHNPKAKVGDKIEGMALAGLILDKLKIALGFNQPPIAEVAPVIPETPAAEVEPEAGKTKGPAIEEHEPVAIIDNTEPVPVIAAEPEIEAVDYTIEKGDTLYQIVQSDVFAKLRAQAQKSIQAMETEMNIDLDEAKLSQQVVAAAAAKELGTNDINFIRANSNFTLEASDVTNMAESLASSMTDGALAKAEIDKTVSQMNLA